MKKLFLLCIFALASLAGVAQEAKMTEAELKEKLQPLMEQLQAIPEEEEEVKVPAVAKQFVQENENEAGVYVLTRVLQYYMPLDELIAFVDGGAYWQSNERVKRAYDSWKIQLATSEGSKFVDFSVEYEGKVSRLSDYVGKGKYVLVDFWASWCGPCRREIPGIIALNEKYTGEKFMVLGVPTWDKPEATKKAMAELGITYPQLMNAQEAGSDAYGIQGIPYIMLFAPDGTVVKRNVHGKALEEAIEQLVGSEK